MTSAQLLEHDLLFPGRRGLPSPPAPDAAGFIQAQGQGEGKLVGGLDLVDCYLSDLGRALRESPGPTSHGRQPPPMAVFWKSA